MDSIESRIIEVLSGAKGSVMIKDIAKKCGVSPHTITRRLDTLELLGRIRKIQIGNAKRYYLVDSLPVSSLIDVSSDLILVIDEKWKIQYLNISAQKKLGLEDNQIIGEQLEQLNLDIFSSHLVLEGLRSFTPEKVSRIELSYDRNNERFWYSVSIMTQYLSSGNLSITIIAEDITEHINSRIQQDLMVTVLQTLNSRYQEGNTVIKQILSTIRQHLLVDAVAIRLYDGEGYPYKETDGLSDNFIQDEHNQDKWNFPKYFAELPEFEFISGNPGKKVKVGEDLSKSLLLSNGRSLWSNSTSSYLSSSPDSHPLNPRLKRCNKEEFESLALIPLHSYGGVIGFLEIYDKRKNVFSPVSIRFYEGLSNSIGIAIERNQVEQRLRESENKYRMLAENVTDVIWTMDLTGSFTYISPSVIHLRGYTAEETMKQSLSEVIPPESLTGVMEMIHKNVGQISQRGDYRAETVEVKQSHKDGSWIWTEVIGRLLYDDNGNPKEIIGISRDISKRKLIQEELLKYQTNLEYLVQERTFALQREIEMRLATEVSLRKSERRLLDIINFTPNATFAIDTHGTIIAWNHAIEELTGYSASDMIGKGEVEYSLAVYGIQRPLLIDLIFEDTDLIEKYYDQVSRDGFVLTAMSSLAMIKGESRSIWIKAAPLFDDQFNLTGVIESIRDIHDFPITDKNFNT